MVDVERGRTVRDWKPTRLGGGLGGLTRKKKEPPAPAPEPACKCTDSSKSSAHIVFQSVCEAVAVDSAVVVVDSEAEAAAEVDSVAALEVSVVAVAGKCPYVCVCVQRD